MCMSLDRSLFQSVITTISARPSQKLSQSSVKIDNTNQDEQSHSHKASWAGGVGGWDTTQLKVY